MAQVRPMRILAPLGGVVRRTSFEGQPDRTLYDSLDFWPVEAKTSRERFAIRPGFAQYNSQATVNLIYWINVAPSETSQRVLVTAAGGTLFTWPAGTPGSVGTGIDTGRNVQAAVYLDTIYIANNAPKKLVYGGSVAGWTGSVGGINPPSNARLICEWGNRIVMAGVTTAPHIWYMSRIGAPNDWLYVTDDDSSPVASTDLDGGQIGGPITSLIPHNRECILFGTASSLTVLRDNPVAGGNLEVIDHVVGPVNGTAWCKSADDFTYFLTRDGLYRMPPGCGTNPTSLSREKIPESLLGLDGIASKVYMAYDVRFRCIHIYVEGTSAQRWHYFPQYEAFVPVTAPGSTISAIGRFDPIETTDKSGVLIGTAGGLMRLDRTASLGGSSMAYAKIGPLRLSATLGEKSQIARAVIKFGDNTDDNNGTVDFYGALDGEAAVALPASRKNRTKISSYDNARSTYPLVGGQAGMLVITQSDTSKHISFEEATLYVSPRGKERG